MLLCRFLTPFSTILFVKRPPSPRRLKIDRREILPNNKLFTVSVRAQSTIRLDKVVPSLFRWSSNKAGTPRAIESISTSIYEDLQDCLYKFRQVSRGLSHLSSRSALFNYASYKRSFSPTIYRFPR